MSEKKPKSKPGCENVLTIGCLVLALVAIAAGSLFWLNRAAIKNSDWFRSFSETVKSEQAELATMLELRTALMSEFPAQEVQIQASTHSSRGSESKKTLMVGFVNPAFAIPESSDDKEAKAREIALVVAAQYPEIEGYDFVSISFGKKFSVGVTVSTKTNFPFDTQELLADLAKETAVDDLAASDPG